jgi:hypothetical protein
VSGKREKNVKKKKPLVREWRKKCERKYEGRNGRGKGVVGVRMDLTEMHGVVGKKREIEGGGKGIGRKERDPQGNRGWLRNSQHLAMRRAIASKKSV